MKRVVTIETSRDYYSIEDAHDEAITIGDLIEILQRYDEDDKVILSNDGGYTYGHIGEGAFDVVTFETEEEEELRDKMDEVCVELTDLEARYENPIEDEAEDEHPMTDEEYRKERANIFESYGITEEEYNDYMGKH